MSEDNEQVTPEETPPSDHRADDATLAYSDQEKWRDCRQALILCDAECARLRAKLQAAGIEDHG